MTNFSRNFFQTITVSTANPAVFTLTDHGLYEGDRVRFETTGTIPTGISLLTDYFVVYNGITTSTFQVSTTDGGTPIAVTGAGSGTLSFIKKNRVGLSPVVEDNR